MARKKKRTNKKKIGYYDKYSNAPLKDQFVNLKNGDEHLKDESKLYVEENKRLNIAVLEAERELKEAEVKVQSLLNQLLDTQEELLHYKYQDNEKLADNHKVLYGARARVEQDLPYRLGKLVLQHSKAPKDLFKIPSILYKEYQSFLAEHNNQCDLPPLEYYKDFQEAEKVKRHLSYRIGVPLASAITSPKSAIKLPYEISKQVYMFKLDKK